MKRHLLWALVILISMQIACSIFQASPENTAEEPTKESPEAPQEPAKTIPAELQYIFEIPADPVQVSANLDSTRQAENVIGPQGGSISVSGADGTTYQLEVPPGALAAETLVRMTPVSNLEGMPFGGETYAVQFQPEGLQFYDFAILTITPAQELPIDQQIFFGYQGEGENLVLVPPVVDSREIKIQLDHFSGYGVSKGFLADIEPVRARIGGGSRSPPAQRPRRATHQSPAGPIAGKRRCWQ